MGSCASIAVVAIAGPPPTSSRKSSRPVVSSLACHDTIDTSHNLMIPEKLSNSNRPRSNGARLSCDASKHSTRIDWEVLSQLSFHDLLA